MKFIGISRLWTSPWDRWKPLKQMSFILGPPSHQEASETFSHRAPRPRVERRGSGKGSVAGVALIRMLLAPSACWSAFLVAVADTGPHCCAQEWTLQWDGPEDERKKRKERERDNEGKETVEWELCSWGHGVPVLHNDAGLSRHNGHTHTHTH